MSSARAVSSSPRAIAVKYTRTTLAASFANGVDAPFALALAPSLVGAALGSAVAASGDGVGRIVGAAVGVDAAGDGVSSRATADALVCADGEGAGDGGTGADGPADGKSDGDDDGDGLSDGRGEGDAFAECDGRGAGVTVSSGDGESLGTTSVAGGIVAATVGDVATVASLGPRFANSERPDPITKPSTITPINTGRSGKEGPSFCGGRRERRGGEPCIDNAFSSSLGRSLASSHVRNGRAVTTAKRARVIRVSVPIDVGTIAAMASSAFALATPIRVERLLELAVTQACGARAPQDKRERSIRTTLDGFRAGKFVVDIDGRCFDRPEAVVVCSGSATLRFFSTEPARRESETAW